MDAVRQVRQEIMEVCVQAQERLGADTNAVVFVMNAMIHATAQYAAAATTPDPAEGQKRFNDLSMKISKVLQDFIAEHTGGAALIELPEKP